jgi:hypothetical protein
MDNLTIKETTYTPEIVFGTDGTLSMKGKSYPENAFEFYEPVMDWLEEYFENNAKEKTTFDIEITYFNSSTSKVLFDMLDLFEENCKDNTITINWIYDQEDESSKEAGEDIIEDFEDLEINLVTK